MGDPTQARHLALKQNNSNRCGSNGFHHLAAILISHQKIFQRGRRGVATVSNLARLCRCLGTRMYAWDWGRGGKLGVEGRGAWLSWSDLMTLGSVGSPRAMNYLMVKDSDKKTGRHPNQFESNIGVCLFLGTITFV